jgi:hypothetical protein
MQMEVLREGLPPGVKDCRDPDRAAEMSRVSTEGQQRVGGGAKEERVGACRSRADCPARAH